MGLAGFVGKAVLAWETRKLRKKGGKLRQKLLSPIKKVSSALQKEITFGGELHHEVTGALERAKAKNPELGKLLDSAYAYAVYPTVGKATAVLGGAFGLGEVFEKNHVVGYTAIVQLTVGLQVGGQTFHEILLFQDRKALDAFKRGKVRFAANASAVIVKAGAAAARGGDGARSLLFSEGGMMLEAGIGAQKFIYRPAALGRARGVDTKTALGGDGQGFLQKARAKAAVPPPIQPPG